MHVPSEGSDVQTCHVPSAITFEFVHEDRYVIYKQMNYLLNLEHFVENAISFVSYAENEIDL